MDRADPPWRLRALIVSLMLATLSGMSWTRPDGHRATVWFDDSLSMNTVEPAGARWSLAAARLASFLGREGITHADIRSLNHPDRQLQLDGNQWNDLGARLAPWFRPGKREIDGKLPPLPLPPGEHWLVTDGANPLLVSWVAKAGLKQIIQVGEATENSAVTGLGLRRSLSSPRRLEGVIRVMNSGRQVVDRKLVLKHDKRQLEHWELSIPPGNTISRGFMLPADSMGHITATLLPPGADPLPSDDQLELDLKASEWIVKISLVGNCPPALDAALAALPGITLAMGDGDLLVTCSSRRPDNRKAPVLWFPPMTSTLTPEGPLTWSSSSIGIDWPILDTRWLRTSAENSSSGDAQSLLSAGLHPLILQHGNNPPLLEVRLDMGAVGLIEQPAYPLLIAGLLEYAIKRAVLDPVETVHRDPLESRIEPIRLDWSESRAIHHGQSKDATSFSAWLLALTLGLLLYDIVRATSFQHRRGTRKATK